MDVVLFVTYWIATSTSMTMFVRWTSKDTRWNWANWLIMIGLVMFMTIFAYHFVIYAQRVF